MSFIVTFSYVHTLLYYGHKYIKIIKALSMKDDLLENNLLRSSLGLLRHFYFMRSFVSICHSVPRGSWIPLELESWTVVNRLT